MLPAQHSLLPTPPLSRPTPHTRTIYIPTAAASPSNGDVGGKGDEQEDAKDNHRVVRCLLQQAKASGPLAHQANQHAQLQRWKAAGCRRTSVCECVE